MCREYIEQLNHLISIAPHLAYAEIKTCRRDTLIDEIESSIRLAGLPDYRARDIAIGVIKGDLMALRLPPFVPKSRFPFTPAAFLAEHDRRLRYDRARNQMMRTQDWCQRRWNEGWSLAEIMMQSKAM